MKVISKIDLLNQLTKGKSYEILGYESNDLIGKNVAFFILNDSGSKAWYSQENLLSLQEHRELNIDNLLQND